MDKQTQPASEQKHSIDAEDNIESRLERANKLEKETLDEMMEKEHLTEEFNKKTKGI